MTRDELILAALAEGKTSTVGLSARTGLSRAHLPLRSASSHRRRLRLEPGPRPLPADRARPHHRGRDRTAPAGPVEGADDPSAGRDAVNAVELLAELQRQGITARMADDGHLRLTGPAENAFTPELRRAVETARVGLLSLLAGEAGGSADAGSVTQSVAHNAAAHVSPADDSTALPGWLAWAGLGLFSHEVGDTRGARHQLG
jgi:hypothetical protein